MNVITLWPNLAINTWMACVFPFYFNQLSLKNTANSKE